MEIHAFVPARAGSTRLKDKNLLRLGGAPLAIRKVRQLKMVEQISRVVLDTDSEELSEIAAEMGIEVLERPSELATNDTDGHKLFSWEASNAESCDIIVQALPTSPFLDFKEMSAALDALVGSDHDSLVTVTKAKNYVWREGRPSYGEGRIPNSVDLDPLIIESMGFYAVKRSSPRFPEKRIGANPLLWEISRLQALDIDDWEDLNLALAIERGKLLVETQSFQLLKHYLSSSILADVSKNLGKGNIAGSEIRPVTGDAKILGRARTMQLSPLDSTAGAKSDDWKQIYEGLGHYAVVNYGDVLCVASDVKSRAYFGEINAHLAVRAGASGAIVDSFTRDTHAVASMGFPVFARGSWANDILFEGKAGLIGHPVDIGGVQVRDGDVVFGDSEGVLFFPAEEWEEVLSQAIDKRFNEEKIKRAIIDGADATEIWASFGDF